MNNTQRIKKHAVGMIVLLIIQYLLGMLTNLYVHFPENASVGQNWEFMHGQCLIWAHLTVGTLIVIGTIALLVRAVKTNDKNWKIAGGTATAAVILAWVCGEEFVSKQIDYYSLGMSVFFIVALVSLGIGLYRTGR